MSERINQGRGLPIAAHLALLVALAVAAAAIIALAVVIWLPPRPPDVMRGDEVIDEFVAGYEGTRTSGRAPENGALRWRIMDSTQIAHSPATDVLAPQLAERLKLDADEVRVDAALVRSETFVYRVRTLDTAPEIDPETRREHRIERSTEITVTHNGDVLIPVPTPPDPNGVGVPAAPEAPRPHVIVVHPEAAAPPAPPQPPTPPPPVFAPAPPGVVLISGFEIAAALPDGRWLIMRQGSNWEELGWIARAALMIGATLTLLSLLALAFARRLAKPIQNFASAVEAVGVDPQSAAIAESGPRELRGAARAVNAMQARLRSLIADRTQTLATVAHDMRTPLMRLRLAAENAEAETRERIVKEAQQVEALISSFIAFARDDPAEEPRVRLDLSALLQSLVDDEAEAGRAVSFDGDERLIITGQSLGLKRLFANLIDNAVKYGGAARVTLRRAEGQAVVDVADDGPGVPPEQREAVFRPFVRLEAAAGGAGLGLPAARSIARAHGGDIAFLDAPAGALVRTTLPL